MRTVTTGRDGPGFGTRSGGRRLGVIAAIAAVLAVTVVGPAQAQNADGGTYTFTLVSVSQPAAAAEAAPSGASAAPAATDRVGLSGYGSVTVTTDPMAAPVTEGTVEGGGSFTHWDSAEDLPVPKPIIAQGTWTADKLVSWDVVGTFGEVTAGTLVLDVTLNPVGGDPVAAQLTIVCNSPPGAGGLATGLLEGWYMTTPMGSFEPFGVGLTTFGLPS